MSESKSPGAVAALGASEDDQLRGTVDPEDSLRGFIAQPLRLRANIPKRISTSPKKPREHNRRRVRARFFGGDYQPSIRKDKS